MGQSDGLDDEQIAIALEYLNLMRAFQALEVALSSIVVVQHLASVPPRSQPASPDRTTRRILKLLAPVQDVLTSGSLSAYLKQLRQPLPDALDERTRNLVRHRNHAVHGFFRARLKRTEDGSASYYEPGTLQWLQTVADEVYEVVEELAVFRRTFREENSDPGHPAIDALVETIGGSFMTSERVDDLEGHVRAAVDEALKGAKELKS